MIMTANNELIHFMDDNSSKSKKNKKNNMEQKLSLQEFNEILSDINSLHYNGYSSPTLTQIQYTGDTTIYKINKQGFENIFLKITTQRDSYGSEQINQVQFAVAKERIVFDYESIK